jgi:Fe-S cluster biosynthesis and repair protein YggX
MADSNPTPSGAAPVRMVQCVKLGKELPGLDRIPWKGEIGKRIYDNVSKDAWKMWVDHSKMLLNEFRLNPLDPQSQKIMEDQMEQFFFGSGAKLPDNYVTPKH